MNELSEIRAAARFSAARGEPLWLATVMRVRGSAYRHAGARMLFTNGRALAGSVSGGFFEGGIVRKGPWLTREHPVCIYFEGAKDEDEEERPSGTGCDGTVDILVEKVLAGDECDPLVLADECLSTEERGVLVTIFESSDPMLPIGARMWLKEDGAFASTIGSTSVNAELRGVAEYALATQSSDCRGVHGHGFEALLEIIEPTPHLFLFGSGPDAVPVAELARTLGLGVTVCDNTGRIAARERFARGTDVHVGDVASMQPLIDARRTALAVVMSHHYPSDSDTLKMLLETRAAYIGMLGPARRTERILRELGRERASLSQHDRARLHAPVGLDLGAQTPAQIALSILAEVQAVLAHANARPLSSRGPRSIHLAEPSVLLSSAKQLARTGST